MLLRTLALLVWATILGSSMGTLWNTTCPSDCACAVLMSLRVGRELRTVDCSHRNLKAVPAEVPHDTQALILRGNAISDLHDLVPELLELQELDVSNNKLRSLGRGLIFHNLSSLIHLNLAKNELTALYNEMFRGLIDLEWLVMSENKLAFIEDQAFQWMSRLRTLELSSNQLSALYVEWFTGLGHLRLLDISSNRVHQINSAAFWPLRRLRQAFLQNNRISDVSNDAFKGLEQLEVLHLENNQLTRVPSQPIHLLPGLQELYLSGNPFTKLYAGDLTGLPITLLQLSHTPSLTVVEADSIRDLPNLLTLHLHDNSQLSFIDPQAMSNMSRLHTVLLHNNRLISLAKAFGDTLHPGVEVSLHGNPLKCDCNVRWIRQYLGSNISHIIFTDPGHLQCASPEKQQGKAVRDLDLKRILKECAPSIVPTVNGTMVRRLGDEHSFDCRAVGIPKPTLAWVLPGGQVLNHTSNSVQLLFRATGTLTFYHLKESDAGIYTCIAENQFGKATARVELMVRRFDIQLFSTSVTSTFVTLVWNGTARNTFPQYTLMYRKDEGSAGNFQHVMVSGFMRSYTVNNLHPETNYEFCIAFRGKDGHLVQVSCATARTLDAGYMKRGIHNTSNVAVAVVLGVVAAMLIIVCFVSMAAKKYRQRQYENPDKPLVSTMSQIPLENLYCPLMSNIGS